MAEGDAAERPGSPELAAVSARLLARPVVLPDTYSGEAGSCNWVDWIEHFENVAAVNGWDDAAKILWMRVRLTGKAQTALKRLPTAARESYAEARKALEKRFEPASKRDLYVSAFQTRRKKRTEGWEDLAEDLRTLSEKAYPQLAEEAREQLALYHFLSLLDDPQVAISVKQTRPATLDEAVSSTLEIESILSTTTTGKPLRVAGVDETAPVPTSSGLDTASVGAATAKDATHELLRTLVERVEKLEMGQRAREPLNNDGRIQRDNRPQLPHRSGPVVCRKCGQEGHYARGCAAPRGRRGQGN